MTSLYERNIPECGVRHHAVKHKKKNESTFSPTCTYHNIFKKSFLPMKLREDNNENDIYPKQKIK